MLIMSSEWIWLTVDWERKPGMAPTGKQMLYQRTQEVDSSIRGHVCHCGIFVTVARED